MTSYPGKNKRLPEKERLPGKIILFFFLILFLVNGLMPSIGLSAFVDREGIKIRLYNITFTEKGHTFTPGSSTRKYTFTSSAMFMFSYKGQDQSAEFVDFKHEATWSGNTHQLTVHSAEKKGHYFDLVYRCGKLDPFLASEPPQCREISRKSNWSGPLTDAWPSYSELPQRLYKAMVVRYSLLDEAISKSMEPVAPKGDITSPPGSVFLQVRVADDLMPEPKMPVFFMIENKQGKPAKSLAGEEINKVRAQFINGQTAFRTINGLAPGFYSFHPQSVSDGFDGPKAYFRVVAKLDHTNTPVILYPADKSTFKNGDKVYISALFNREKGQADFDIEMKQGVFKPFDHVQLTIHNNMADTRRVFPENHVYRVRASVISQASSKGSPVWSQWRYFTVGEHFISGFKRGLSIISPTFSKTYTNTVPVKVVLPEKLNKETTMTLNWIWGYSAPAAAPGQVPAASIFPRKFYSQKVTVKPGVDFSESEISVAELMKHKDSAVPGTAAKAGYYELEVTLKTKQGIQQAQTWGPFHVGMLGEPVPDNQGQKKSGTLLLDTPIFTAPAEGQVFMAPARVEVTMIHRPEVQVQTELAYCPFSKKKTAILSYQTSSIKPVVKKQKEKGKTTLIYTLEKPGYYQIRAVNNDKIGVWSQWRSFKVDTLNRKAVSSVKLTTPQGITIIAPDIIEPRNNQVFKAGTTILLRINKLAPAPFTSFYFQLDEKLNADKEYRRASTTVVVNKTYRQIMGTHSPDLLLLPGKYRVRAAYRDANKKEWTDMENLHWSDWQYFTVIPNLKLKIPAQIPQKSFTPNIGVSASQPHQIKTIGKLGNTSINPHPEPPGKQIGKTGMPLVVMMHPRTFRPTGSINIPVKNTPFSRVPFELRYRPAPGKPYRIVKTPSHSFSRKNGVTSLHLNLKRQGEYQVRFRKNHKAPWTGWSSFQVLENPTRAAVSAQRMRMTPTASRMINPQPEPPGKQMRNGMAGRLTPARNHTPRLTQNPGARTINPQPEPPGKVLHHGATHHIGSRVTKPGNIPTATFSNTAVKLHIAPPKIREPHNGQKFLLTGNKVHVKTKVEYTGREHIQVEVQQKKKGRYITLRPQVSLSKTGNITAADISLSATGSYRLRVRAGNNGHWSNWSTFTVDKFTKNMPALRHSMPAVQTNKPVHTATPFIKPSLQPVR